MATGTIKFFNPRSGFGFIVPDKATADSPDIYFNRSSLARDRQYDPVEGDKVQFETRSAEKGTMAVRIVIQ